MHVDYPYRLDRNGRTMTADERNYIMDLVEVTLMTSPGERVNHPEFGAGLNSLIFEPNSQGLTEATSFLIKSNLQRWLKDIVQVDSLEVEREDSSLIVDLVYTVLETAEIIEQRIVRG